MCAAVEPAVETSAGFEMALYFLPNDTPVCVLDCQEALKTLTEEERLYAHYLAHTCFTGGLIVLFQVSVITTHTHTDTNYIR
jgi:hypothetical protein